MKILVLGSGGREHALAWKLSESTQCEELFIAPGNAGTDSVGENIDLSVTDFEGIKQVVLQKQINLVVVGPEAPLVEGITDFFKQDSQLSSVTIIGPSQDGAQLEGSKDFSKDFMNEYGIPTARHKTVTPDLLEEGKQFLEKLKPPYVLKADGLAAGKGVLILDDLETAKKELEAMLGGKFGDASSRVVIEEFLNGIELSVFVLTDGSGYKLLPSAKDYKRIGEGDTGLNTGGMGAISPVPFVDEAFLSKVEKRIVQPTIKGLQNREIDYKGFIFIGLMNVGGDPYVIEYNVRMGDPETEVVIPRIKSDLIDLFRAVSTNTLEHEPMEVDERTAATVMLVSAGYPEAYEKGKAMTGFQHVRNSMLFHAGTKLSKSGIVTNGGRVLAITSFGRNRKEALELSYQNAALIKYNGKVYRNDIGFDLN